MRNTAFGIMVDVELTFLHDVGPAIVAGFYYFIQLFLLYVVAQLIDAMVKSPYGLCHRMPVETDGVA